MIRFCPQSATDKQPGGDARRAIAEVRARRVQGQEAELHEDQSPAEPRRAEVEERSSKAKQAEEA